jgi:hypothetical protein
LEHVESPDDAEGRTQLEEIAKLAQGWTARIIDGRVRRRSEALTKEIVDRLKP